MKNNYEIRGETTAIFIKRRNGDVYECLIDTEDLPRVSELRVTLALNKKRKDCDKYYVHFHRQLGYKKHTKASLHRLITNAPVGLVVDHINGNPLDNRKVNLRLITNSENMQNLCGPHRDNKTGIRGVTKDRHGKKYQVIIQVEKRTHYLGVFDSAEEAGRVAEKFRRDNMPYSEDSTRSRGDAAC